MRNSDEDMTWFLATRELPKVRAERFVVSPRVMIRRNYDNDTENELLLIRAQQKNQQIASKAA